MVARISLGVVVAGAVAAALAWGWGAFWVYLFFALVAGGLGIIYGFPRLTEAVPSPLVAIVVLSALAIALKIDVRTVGDMGSMPSTLPVFRLPAVPLTWETLRIIAPVSATLAFGQEAKVV